MCILITVLFVALALCSACKGAEMWPFSPYPMFSRLFGNETLVLVRVALEHHNGESRWWRPRFYKLQQTWGRRLLRELVENSKEEQLQMDQLIRQTRGLIKSASGIGTADRFYLVLRQCKYDGTGHWTIRDKVLLCARLDGPLR